MSDKYANIDPMVILNEKERQKCLEIFESFDKNVSGALDADELKQVLEELGHKPTYEEIFKLIHEVDTSNQGAITYKDFLKIIAYQKVHEDDNEEYDTLDAFVALGGSSNKEGYINANTLIKIIKEDFNMTIDIERLIREIDTDNSGKIEYPEFKELLSK